MAPFLTHLAVGERVWAALDGKRPEPDHFGTFLFGCLAPDVDKFCHGLEQGTTHFMAKDEGGTYVWQRSQRFLEGQDDYLRAPYHKLESVEKAFVIGYLCHIATDEITARRAQAIMSQNSASSTDFPHVDAILTAMDPRFWAMTRDPAGLVAALDRAAIPNSAFVFTDGECLRAMYQVVVPEVVEGGGLVPFIHMLRRQWQWTRHGQVSDAADDPQLEADLAAFRRRIEADLPTSERLVEKLDLASFLQEANRHSLERIHALLEGRGVP